MAIDYAGMAKGAAQNREKDTMSFKEGYTLFALVPYERGFPVGTPSVTVQIFSGKDDQERGISKTFKRSVVTYDQDYVRESEAYQEALGFEPPGVCPLMEFGKANYGSKGRQLQSVSYWVIVPVAYRSKPNQPWQEDYTKPKIMTAKQGKSSDPHIQGGIDKLLEAGGAELAMKLLADPTNAQLLVVEREGMGMTDTSFKVSLAEEDEYKSYDLGAEVIADVESATKQGGPCDLNHFIASKFSPDAEEIVKRLHGGEAPKSEEGMSEG